MVFIPHDRIFYRVTEKQTKLRCGNTSRLWVNVSISAVLSFPELLRVFLFYFKMDKMFSNSVKKNSNKNRGMLFRCFFFLSTALRRFAVFLVLPCGIVALGTDDVIKEHQ